MADETKHTVKPAFEAANPPAFEAIQGDQAKFRALRELDDWAMQERARLAQDVKDHKQQWVAKEVEAIHLERQKAAPGLTPPIGQGSYLEEARRRIDGRIKSAYRSIAEQRLERIKAITQGKQTPQQRENSATRKPAHPYKRTQHKTWDDALKTVVKIHVHFGKNWHRFVENARQRGADNPISEVSQRRARMIERVRKAVHRRLDAAYTAHDVDRAFESHERLDRRRSQDQSGPSFGQ